MIPSLLDSQIRQGVSDFLRTTFPITTWTLNQVVEDLCQAPGQLFQGPWISLGLPFAKGSEENFFPNLHLGFQPYSHQEKAWRRLEAGKSTLIATGTGSGKTECFLYPVLEQVRRQVEAGQGGVKAILIYPMNALATDQARRLAKAIAKDPALSNVRAGLYVGGEQKLATKTMTADSIITDRETLRLDPPDILLTNYKMLDLLLLRPRDQRLWSQNRPAYGTEPSTLRTLVVDEIHSFDGAQGTDLAFLVRRLKDRLGCSPGNLCCVGTSATMGGKEDAARMQVFARSVFGEEFDDESLITETRQTPREFLSGVPMRFTGVGIPGWGDRAALDARQIEDPRGWLEAQLPLWFPGRSLEINNRIRIAEELKGHPVFRSLVEVVGMRPLIRAELLRELSRTFAEFDPAMIASQAGLKTDSFEVQEFLESSLNSLLALVAWARSHDDSGRETPLIQQVRVQSWIRELRRMVVTVEPKTAQERPRLRFSDDLAAEGQGALPLVYCRECGSAGWAGLLTRTNGDQLAQDPQALKNFYRTYFSSEPSQNIRFLFPDHTEINGKVCQQCLKLLAPGTQCGCGGDATIAVHIPDSLAQTGKGKWIARKNCPCCHATNSLVLLGSQAASMGSALINQLFASHWNDDKKLIAFSDNVQDASQRAAFFGARTWRFNLRAAVQQYLQSLPDSEEIPLLGLGRQVLAHTRQHGRLSEEAVAFLFLPSDLGWVSEVVEMRRGIRTSFTEDFWRRLGERIEWEVFCEFTFESRKGRTLEKSDCATATLGCSWTSEQVADLCARLSNDIPALRGNLTPDSLENLLQGMLHRWLHKGAVSHPRLNGYINDPGNSFLISPRDHWLPSYGRNARLPSFPWIAVPGKDRQGHLEDLVTQQKKATSWLASWLYKAWGSHDPFMLTWYDQATKHILESLVEWGVLERHDVAGTSLWSIPMVSVRVSRRPIPLVCDVCGVEIATTNEAQASHVGMPCLNQGCRGHFAPRQGTRLYYGQLYRHGALERLHPQEHTSLLEREEREEVERRFKAHGPSRRAWDPNLLSCTPTLEMGIDIGDLSSVLLCSMPPKQSAFLQRIGRAGRTDGNAWIGTIAEANPHDLYFWEEPDEMLSGKVEPPGVFLDASAVVERQLIAYAMDRWVREVKDLDLPRTVRDLTNQKKKNAGFYRSLRNFLQKHSESILADFLRMTAGYHSDPTRQILSHVLLTATEGPEIQGSLFFRLNDALETADRCRSDLERKRKSLDQDLQTLADDPTQSEELVAELKLERDALSRLIQKLDERDVYQFLTDEGFLPNYAFPESGVQLKSVIYRKSGTGQKSLKDVYEYERAAASAITEFAPGNWFYAHGRKVRIDRVDISQGDLEPWRLCPECGHMEIAVDGSSVGNCPRCEAPGFAGQEQVRKLLRVRQVHATTQDRESLVGDDSDAREVKYFERSLQVGLANAQLLGAWMLNRDDVPFGFEVLRKVALREINFGPWEIATNSTMRVGGKDIASPGFRICLSCGKVELKGVIQHTFHCVRTHPQGNQKIQDSLLFYRDFEGEALRLFLPTVSVASDVPVRSFLAAFHLGLRLHYQGDISHLESTLQSEPIPDNPQLRKNFVVIHDKVPGGTGYLRQFRDDPQLILEVLGKARARMASCRCQHVPGKDGCYHCILAHRNSREMDSLSRSSAIGMIDSILKSGTLREKSGGLSKVSVNALLESELEQAFVAELARQANDPRTGIEFKACTLESKNGWRLRVGRQSWLLEPQFQVSREDGLGIETRIDFVFRHETDRNFLPIAIYLDGWEFHCKGLRKDTQQRLALHRSGRWRIWTLAWEDIQDAQKSERRNSGPAMLEGADSVIMKTLMDRSGLRHEESLATKSGLLHLLAYLGDPDEKLWKTRSYAQAFALLDKSRTDEEGWRRSIAGRLPQSHPSWYHLGPGFGIARAGEGWSLMGWIGKAGLSNLGVLLEIDADVIQGSGNRRIWLDWWHTVNRLQFLSDFVFLEREAQKDGAYDHLPLKSLQAEGTDLDENWQSLVEGESDLALRSLLLALHAAGADLPEPYGDVASAEGDTLASTLLMWPKRQAAVVYDSSDITVLESHGWKAIGFTETGVDGVVNWWKGASA